MRRPPLAFLGGPEEYTSRDNLLLMAHKRYESERCECGFRRSVCSQEPSRHQWFEVDDEDFCHAEAALEDHKSSEGYKPEPGQRLTVLLKTLDGVLTADT